jgi:hypothetical protein
MPELREVFEMTTKQMEPDVESWRDQQERQRRRSRNRKVGAIAVAAAVGVVAAVLILSNRSGERGTGTIPAGKPSPAGTTSEPAGTVGTVMFDGSTCSIEITAARIEPGAVLFDAVNATDRRVMFDSWQLLDGYTFHAFEATVARDRRLAAKGRGTWPSDREVQYLRSDIIPANSSGVIAATMSQGAHAITCLDRYPGQGLRPFGIAGPITVG